MKLFVIFVFALFKLNIYANVIDAPILGVSYEQEPSNLEWRAINTEHFEIIFPTEVENKAQQVAHLLEKAYPFVSRSMEVMPTKIPVVLHNQSMTSNGFVTLAPRRSELYLTPSIDTELTNTDWLKTLAVHEFRHVVQFQKSKQGFNKVFHVLFGELGDALGIGLTMPQWFLEGDAVGIETALTIGGRGRLPLFDRDLRALLLAGKNWGYDKSYFGSYKDYQPNHYVYGYFLTSWLRNHYGDLALSKIVDRASDRSWNPLTFYHAVEEITNKNFEDLYKDVMKELLTEWTAKADELNLTPYEVLNTSKRKTWTNYYFPQILDDGRIFALKKGLNDIAQFVVLNGSKEKTLFYPAPLIDEYPFQVRGNRFAFFEIDLDTRWGFKDHSRLKVYDIKKNEFIFNKAGQKGRLAVLDQTGEKILFVIWNEKQEQYLIIKNLDDQELVRKALPNTGVVTSLDWISENEVVYVYKDENDLKSVHKMFLETDEVETLMEPGPGNIGRIIVTQNEMLVESSVSGIDNIFLLKKNELYQITSSLNGAYSPTIANGELIYNDYTGQGMDIVRKKIDWKEEQNSENSFFPIYEKFSKAEMGELFQSELLTKENYESRPYSKLKNSVNFHSWIILAPPLTSLVSLSALSRDTFNTFSLALGTEYDLNERTLLGYTSLVWSHNYPVFDLRGAYGGRRVTFKDGRESTWEEGTFESGVSIPWTYLSGRFVHTLRLRGFGNLIKVVNKRHGKVSEVRSGALLSPGVDLQYSSLSRLARRDLNPSYGFMLKARFEEGRDITGVNEEGRRVLGTGTLYLPGVFTNHSFYHQLAYEKQDANNYQYSSLVFYPRGTQSVFLDEFHKYSGNYSFPLFYPDWNLGRFIYFKRLSANLFYDELVGKFKTFDYFAASTGWEVLTEMNILRIAFPLTIGVRGSYPIKGLETKSNYEVFLASNIGIF